MPTAIELGRELTAKREELKTFLDARTKEGVITFVGDDQKAFNDRNDELGPLHDAWQTQASVEQTAKDNDQHLKNLKGVTRRPLWDNGEGLDYRPQELKSAGQMFMESDEYKANCDNAPSHGQWKVELKQASVSDSMKAALSTSTAVLPYAPARAGVVPYATRRPVMRELVPTDDSAGALVQFIRETAPSYGATITAEGVQKSETSLGTERVVLQVEAIAHYIKVTDQALRFIPGMQDLIDRRGGMGILLKEEDYMLNYNGSAGWKGYLYQSGVQTSALGTQNQFTAFHQGMNLIQYTGFANVTGAVMHNNDWHKLITTQDSMGRFVYGDPLAATQNTRLWGVPVIVTPAITEGTVLAGDFVMDSKWWTAGGLIVKVGYNGTDLTYNQQTIVVEEYGALEIDRPASFVKMTGWDAIA